MRKTVDSQIKIILIILIISISLKASSQFSFKKPTMQQSGLNAELLGNGLLYSLNYESMMKRTDVRWTNIRVGIELLPSGVLIPLEYDWMWGKNIKYFEVGGGLLISPNNIGSPLGLIRIGYRRMPSDGGFMFRAGVCGFIVPNELIGKSLPPILPWPAISFGYAFKAKKLKF
jgi:hypothetical protein